MHHLLFKRWKFIALVGLMFAVISTVITLLFPLEYRADAQVLIISKTRYGVDPYTVVKSAERVGENLAQVMETDDFLRKVREAEGYRLDWSRFDGLNERQKRRAWPKMIAGSVVYGTGVLNVSTYHSSAEQAKLFSAAVSDTVVNKAWEYVGADVILKVVNSPIVTRFPARPNIFLNVLLGFVAGLFVGSAIVSRRHL